MTLPPPDATPFSASEVAAIRADFPVLHQQVNGKALAYLDNAASTQHPRQVIDAEAEYYRHDHANIHRGVHTLSQRATDAFEAARHKLQHFLHARSHREVILTRGTATPAPTSSAPAKPGPWVKAITSISASATPDSLSTARVSGITRRIWSRDANSGTTPP